MTRETLCDLARASRIGKDVRRQLPALCLQSALISSGRILTSESSEALNTCQFELFDLRFEFGDRLFKVEKRDGHTYTRRYSR